MGELLLVSGPNDSGKSRWTEALLARDAGPRWYLATMDPRTPENDSRIEKHRRQRAGLGFRTVELPCGLDALSPPPEAAVLLEDVSNLLANLMFQRGGDGDAALGEILSLLRRVRLLAAVTISGLRPEGYSGETADYIRELNRLNLALYAHSAAAVTMERGAPRVEKGDPEALLRREGRP